MRGQLTDVTAADNKTDFTSQLSADHCLSTGDRSLSVAPPPTPIAPTTSSPPSLASSSVDLPAQSGNSCSVIQRSRGFSVECLSLAVSHGDTLWRHYPTTPTPLRPSNCRLLSLLRPDASPDVEFVALINCLLNAVLAGGERFLTWCCCRHLCRCAVSGGTSRGH